MYFEIMWPRGQGLECSSIRQYPGQKSYSASGFCLLRIWDCASVLACSHEEKKSIFSLGQTCTKINERNL